MIALIIIVFYILPFIVCTLLGRYYNNVEFIDKTNDDQVEGYVIFSVIPILNMIAILIGIFHITKDFVRGVGTK
jgi:hypothetical protein